MTPIASSCLVAALAVPACRSNGWQAAPSMLAPARCRSGPRRPLRPEADGIDPSAIPLFDPPSHVRACCQLGMDLHLKAGDVQIPGYQRGNVTQVGDLGHHVYDGGLFPVYEDSRGTGVEQNGIVYTCRGGFADTAHIRDYADWTFFLGLRLSRSLPEGTTVVLPGDGAIRRIVVRALPWALVADRGRFAVAATLAQWLAFRIAIWHEIATWFGWESFRGFPRSTRLLPRGHVFKRPRHQARRRPRRPHPAPHARGLRDPRRRLDRRHPRTTRPCPREEAAPR
ncbi:MAG: DUF4056 domain-containing protein [Polyangiaceae bacterium]